LPGHIGQDFVQADFLDFPVDIEALVVVVARCYVVVVRCFVVVVASSVVDNYRFVAEDIVVAFQEIVAVAFLDLVVAFQDNAVVAYLDMVDMAVVDRGHMDIAVVAFLDIVDMAVDSCWGDTLVGGMAVDNWGIVGKAVVAFLDIVDRAAGKSSVDWAWAGTLDTAIM
jgi:hypothetical protein